MASSSRARKILGLVENNLSSDDNNKVAVNEKPQYINNQSFNSLVPCYDSDMTMSDNENTTRDMNSPSKIVATNILGVTLPSSSSSSSSSSSDSSSSSSGSNSETKSLHETNPLPHVSCTDEENDVIENTPPELLNKNRQKKSNLRRQETRNYQISPLHADESDVDLSDTDPTFINTGPKRRKNYLFIGSSSSSSSMSEMAVTSPRKRGRKRTKNPSKWKQNQIKCMRNMGKSYVSSSKSKKQIPARSLKEPCTEKCRLKCTEKISIDSRYNIFRNFWDLGDLLRQRAYIRSCMKEIEPKYKYSNAAQPRRNNKSFYFIVDNINIRVCKTFFKSTLDISDRMIFTIQTKVNDHGFELEDLRGKHNNHRKIDPQIRIDIKKHINSIPKIESHYLRSNTTREYIESSKTIKDLYNDFKLQQEEINKEAGTYITYYKIFTTEFNLGFFQPKKDQCDLCTSYHNSNADQKIPLEKDYMTHLEEKNISRIEKLNDRKKVNDNFKVVVYDLEAVLQCPRGDSSAFYYKSKLNCYNLTVTELTNKDSKVAYENVHCYFWTECDAKRGAVEIGTCIWNYLKAISDQDENEKEIVFYSDNTFSQNKNKYITSLYLFAVHTLKIKSITHKFLIRGHTQNEADSVHSLIEKEVKRNLKSGPIYTPDQYIALIKNAKKSKQALNVHELNFKEFYDLKALQEDWGYNFTTNTDGQTVNWNEIKVLSMTKENPTIIFYKTSYKEDCYKEVDVRNKRKKMIPTTEVTLDSVVLC
ncbi:uncharacterized protein LOC128671409 [Plodia interpunctella]|uniref:uncharacterized protein LOC128671409 n=1 Tax=Plodia interpunctella TaxID=58824 RepID=UPI002367BBC5|nr:uncharacterized protein LOC128671409 [Plodia interpunctella]